MTKIQLIPVVELPHPAEAWEAAGARPTGTRHESPEDWERFLRAVNAHSGYGELKSYPIGSHRYPVTQLSPPDVDRLVKLHLGDTPIEESCALFGGYVLAENGRAVLVPQCCGTLAEIASWRFISRREPFEEHYLSEGHPAPRARSDGSTVEIVCLDEHEAFEEPAPELFTVSRNDLAVALERAERVLDGLAGKLDDWGMKNGFGKVADTLIHEAS